MEAGKQAQALIEHMAHQVAMTSTTETAASSGRGVLGRSSSLRLGNRAKPSSSRSFQTATGLRWTPNSARFLLMS